MASNPTDYGWRYDGHIVAPAVDPYLRMMPVARGVMDRAGVFNRTPIETDFSTGSCIQLPQNTHRFPKERARGLNSLTGTNTYVVTNSHTEPVQDKIRHLDKQHNTQALNCLERVTDEQKYILDPSFDAVEDSLHIPNLDCPIKLEGGIISRSSNRSFAKPGPLGRPSLSLETSSNSTWPSPSRWVPESDWS